MNRNAVILLLFATFTFVFSTLLFFLLGFESLEAMKLGLVASALNFIAVSLMGAIVDALFK